jgi:hypothetical protein
MPLFAPFLTRSSIVIALICRIRRVCCFRHAARSKLAQLLALRLALRHLCFRLCTEELVREIRIRVGRVPARFLVKLAKQLSIAAAAAAAIAPLALFTHARGHGLRVARPIITQRSEADRTRASPAAPVASSLANGKNGPETCLYYE